MLKNSDLMSNPPYSSDLAPNDFFLFTCVKDKMRDQRFSTPEESGWCVQTACYGDILIRVAKVLRHLVQTNAKLYRS